ncbi:hypothetical protein [Nitrosomonas oligotropha]|uniref:Uncharacterized protein n=1 Tax=Nitrosomonas oligotropha TaxID=42354 RepID=A0A1H8VU01_9PROT|nr:hypothetical protein [Nitrosomonas oligotropha]SDX65326.1 hypothetical protein SAMN05216300_1782 [Nitrosomonas oligotropha]SEP18763.1 hypothetical protein SAMN05216333_1802 [Nitrosomonas oligotropha]
MLDTMCIEFVPFSEGAIVTSNDVWDSDIVVPEFLSWMTQAYPGYWLQNFDSLLAIPDWRMMG